jgi:hypothetical protein
MEASKEDRPNPAAAACGPENESETLHGDTYAQEASGKKGRKWPVKVLVLVSAGLFAVVLIGSWGRGVFRSRPRIESYGDWSTGPAVAQARASCCATGCGGGRSQSLDLAVETQAKAKGLEYYTKKTGKTGASARVTDFGCHIQVDILEGGKVALSLTYTGGEVREI